MTTLCGGWGYNNLGDEAILAGYLETVASNPLVYSVNPQKTIAAQCSAMTCLPESSRFSSKQDEVFMLCGGGYINGSWVPEVTRKLNRLQRLRGGRDLVAHGLELRSIKGKSARQLTKLFAGGQIAVRDEESKTVALGVGIEATVLPDAISLLAPHIEKYSTLIDTVQGRVLVNLLDITRRPDSVEAEISVDGWRKYCGDLVAALGDRALALDIGSGDRDFANELRIEVVTPRSVGEMVSLIASTDGIVSVRMHPALIGTILGTPTVSIPYCGKVSPTLQAIGVQPVILYDLDVNETLERLEHRGSWAQEWSAATNLNQQWLEEHQRTV